jgi:predicted nucleotidyltransferase
MTATIRDVCASRSDIAAVYLFGSAARGSLRVDSDIDLGVLFTVTPEPTLQDQPFDLAEDLSRRLGRRVDLVVLDTAPADLRVRVLRDGILIVDREPAHRIRFEVRTRNEAFDLEPILREYRRARPA